eukprot:GGOE01001921.1.p1 GENE.GGOE01001921.1~~GGOE01001921.1.p1  ORF type:complete len:887 (+),score=274.16 GGOE01001921.1:122-2782(+)
MEKYGFEKIKVIGKGAFGSAILVRNSADGKKYVAKEVNLFRMKREEREEAKNEIKVLSKLNHPNIVRYLIHFEENSMLYIVMEYADGGDLDSRIKSQRGQPFREDAIMHYFVQVCMALKHLHDRKTLHRDLKGQNIFLTSTNVVKLGDFGISTILMNTNAQARTMCGTPYYFSPELCQNRPYNNKSDIWSLGCILYELATLKHAFEGQNMKGLLQKIVRGNYPAVSPSYSADLRTLIDSMLQRDPNDRPSVNAILRLPFVQARIQQICGSDPVPPPNSGVDDMAAELVRRREEGMRERLLREKERKEQELRVQQDRNVVENERVQRERREQLDRVAQAELERKQRFEREAKRREELLLEAEEKRKRDAARLQADTKEREAERERQVKLRAEKERERKQREVREKEVQRKRELQWQGLGVEVMEGAEGTPTPDMPVGARGQPVHETPVNHARQLALEEARKAAFWEGKLAAQRNKQKCMDVVAGLPNVGPGAPADPVAARPSSGPPKRPPPVVAEAQQVQKRHSDFLAQRRAAEANKQRIVSDIDGASPRKGKAKSPVDMQERVRERELKRLAEEKERERALADAYRQQRQEAERNRRRIYEAQNGAASKVLEPAPVMTTQKVEGSAQPSIPRPCEGPPTPPPPPSPATSPPQQPSAKLDPPAEHRRAASAPELSVKRASRPLLKHSQPHPGSMSPPAARSSPPVEIFVGAKGAPSASASASFTLSDSSDEMDVSQQGDNQAVREQEYRSMQSNMQEMLCQLQAAPDADDEGADFAEADDKIANLVQLLGQCKVDGHTLRPPMPVSDSDPLMTRIEVLRQIVEDSLGVTRFKEVYNCLNTVSQDDDEDEAQLKALTVLSEEYVSFLPLIMQLIFCEDEINIRANRCS